MSQTRAFRSYVIALVAGVEYSLTVPGTVMSVVEAASEFTVTFDEGNRFAKITRGLGLSFQTPYSQQTFFSEVDQTITVVLGFGTFSDSRALIDAVVNTTIEPANNLTMPGDASVSGAATLLAAASSTTKEVKITVPSTSDFGIRVGGATVTNTSGDLIEPGASATYSCEAALYGIREAGAIANVTATVLIFGRT